VCRCCWLGLAISTGRTCGCSAAACLCCCASTAYCCPGTLPHSSRGTAPAYTATFRVLVLLCVVKLLAAVVCPNCCRCAAKRAASYWRSCSGRRQQKTQGVRGLPCSAVQYEAMQCLRAAMQHLSMVAGNWVHVLSDAGAVCMHAVVFYVATC
jgi:hypothetical protein